MYVCWESSLMFPEQKIAVGPIKVPQHPIKANSSLNLYRGTTLASSHILASGRFSFLKDPIASLQLQYVSVSVNSFLPLTRVAWICYKTAGFGLDIYLESSTNAWD